MSQVFKEANVYLYLLASLWAVDAFGGLPTRVLVDYPSGEQALLQLAPKNDYHTPSAVVWLERRDGPLPVASETIGGYIRCGQALCEDAARRAEHDIAVAAKELQEQQAESVKAAIVQCEANVDALLDDWNNATAADVKNALRCVLRKLRRK